jgi:hypothetical protein
MRNLLSIFLCCALWSPLAQSEGIVLITHGSSPQRELNREEAADLFLGKRRALEGNLISVFDISDDRLQEAFYQSVADMSMIRLKAYWSRLVFSGQGRPPPKISLADALDRINQDKSSITYAYASAVPRGTKVLLRLQ